MKKMAVGMTLVVIVMGLGVSDKGAAEAAWLTPTKSTATTKTSSLSLQATTTTAATATAGVLSPPRVAKDLTSTVTKDLYDKSVQNTYGRFPVTIKNGQGCRLYTVPEEGAAKPDFDYYLDFASGIATCIVGHNCQELNDAVYQQMQSCHHVSNLYYIPPQAALADWLTTNSKAAEKVFFCNSGAEANEAAIKCARKYASETRGITKPIIITAVDSFHGRTLAAISATGQPKYHKGFTYGGEMVPGFKFVPYNDPQALEKAVKEIQQQAKTEEGVGLAAIMMEPLQGEGGVIPGSPDFFATIRRLCDETGALMICDEVQIGMGRSGTLWGHEQFDGATVVVPDIFTSAKALGGGVPIGAMMAGKKAANVFGPGDHASTYGGNPLACAAGLAVANILCRDNLLDNTQQRGEQLSNLLAETAKRHPGILGQPRGWGLLKGIPVTAEGVTAASVVAKALARGLLLVPAGQNVVRFVPPLIVSEAEIQQAMDIFEKVITDVENEVTVKAA